LNGSFSFLSRPFAAQVAIVRSFCCGTWEGEQLDTNSTMKAFQQPVCYIDMKEGKSTGILLPPSLLL
jgi:hypothetical protein